MMKSICMLCAIAALAGCAGAPVKPEPAVVVNKAVAVGCLGAAPVMPMDAFSAGPWPGDKAAAQAALVDREAWKLYATRLLASQAGCDKKPP